MKNKKLITLALTILMLLTFSLSCFAAGFLDGKYILDEDASPDFDGLFYADKEVVFTTDIGDTFKGLKIDDNGLSFWSNSQNSYSYFKDSPYGEPTYLIFNNQSVNSEFHTAFTSAYCFKPNIVEFSDFGSVLSKTEGQFNVTTILGVFGLVVGGCVVLAFLWWGVRKIISAVMTAFKKGKISL